jgi:hypothetical protein
MIGFSNFKNFRLLYKMTALSALGMILFFSGILFYILPKIEDTIMLEKQSTTKYLVEIAVSILEVYSAQEVDGKMDAAAMRTAALQEIAIGSSQVSTSTQDLSDLAKQINQMMSKFKI